MDISVYSINEITDGELHNLISNRKSFVLDNINRLNMPEAVKSVEKAIEAQDMKCRVYTKGRVAAMTAELAIPMVGWAAAAAIGVHNLATWDPDYEIAKNILTGSLTVQHKK